MRWSELRDDITGDTTTAAKVRKQTGKVVRVWLTVSLSVLVTWGTFRPASS
jgi:hypothetical protein